MARVIQYGGIVGYIQPTGEQISGDGTTTYQVQVDQGDGEVFLAAAVADRFKAVPDLGGYLQPGKCSVSSGHFDTVTLVFSSADSVTTYPGTGERIKTTFGVTSNMLEKPLAQHKNYLYCWDHNLYLWVRNGQSVSDHIPPFVEVDKTDASADNETYAWGVSTPAARNNDGGWRCIYPMKKPGIAAYLFPAVVVQKREFFRSEKGMEEALRKRGVIEKPEKFAHLAADWLVTDCSPDLSGDDDWICLTEYTGADHWDRDLYEEAK